MVAISISTVRNGGGFAFSSTKQDIPYLNPCLYPDYSPDLEIKQQRVSLYLIKDMMVVSSAYKTDWFPELGRCPPWR